MSLDLSGDWALVDDPVTVSYKSKTAEGTFGTAASITHCQRHGIEREDVEKDPALLQQQASVFHLWKAKCAGGFLPAIGDRLSFDSLVWIVRSVGYLDRDANGVQRYRLVVIKSTGAQTL